MCGCARIQNSLGLTETWVDGIGAPQIDGKIVRLPCYVRRGKSLHLVACIALTIDAAPLADTLVTGLLAMPDDASKSICRVYGWTSIPTDFSAGGDVEKIMVVRLIIERDALLDFVQTTMRNLFMG